MATIRDVARLAGVSISTVSRVLNKSGYVNSETEREVNKAIQMLKYEPSDVARGLTNKKTRTIALILPDIVNPFFPELSRAVEDVARTSGYTVIFGNSDGQANKEKAYINILKQKYISGIIFASHNLNRDDVEYLQKIDIPFVVLDRAPSQEGCTVVRSNNFEGAKLAVQHLLDVGCKKIAHIYGPQEINTAKDRLSGYEESVKNFKWYSPTLMVPGNFKLDGGMNAAHVLMERHPDVDGIFVGNDLMAVGALKTLLRLGIKVPNQIAICGFDGIHLAEAVEPELTTIAQPIYEMGALAADLLIKKIEGAVVDNRIYELEVKLVPRASTTKEI
ncbi:LacI family DNA-binding transcriptional regulator [Desulfosporosinus sp. FKB]|uniref:LacI family DNA-binding transcriptional regulator n=1 Tax=Desulfosporosinus sp. FKB TaxID=1969835 RepID=UPI000B497444|nr:LacI family DNA-binding transcriptional regulator [Desulfosporosinus sp. FKB]